MTALLLISGLVLMSALPANGGASQPALQPALSQGGLPFIRRVNVPYFSGTIPLDKTAVFWFGKVTSIDNYADVRMGYNATELLVDVRVADRLLWYDPNASAPNLSIGDTATLYLTPANLDQSLTRNSYKFVAQFTWWEPPDNYRKSYQGSGSGWSAASIPFSTASGWRGNAPNDLIDDRGWTMTYQIPFSSFGLSRPPSQGTVWGLGLSLHNQDDAADSPRPTKVWPETMNSSTPATWGQLAFGMPVYTPPPITNPQTITIANRLNNQTVLDGEVGGQTNCGGNLNYWTQWGDAVYQGYQQINVQNEADIADWPCFSKIYLTFPLSTLPPAKQISSARFTIYQFGNSDATLAQPSLIQIATVNEDWAESTLSWNNAPLVRENISQTVVNPLTSFPGWPGMPNTWDVSKAVDDAYRAGQPLRLVLYSADTAYHSGKYFTSSHIDDWDASGRPALRVLLGDTAGLSTATPTSTSTATLTPTRTATKIPSATAVPSPTPSPTPSQTTKASAQYLGTDSTTQGTWKGVYGNEGYTLEADRQSLPAYATVAFGSARSWTWATSTTDARALQKSASATDRLAATWYDTASFTIDLNLTDGKSHKVSLYSVDWDFANRAQTVDVVDASTQTVLDTSSLSGFGRGAYLSWNLTGHVHLRITSTAGANAVVSGVFFDPRSTTRSARAR